MLALRGHSFFKTAATNFFKRYFYFVTIPKHKAREMMPKVVVRALTDDEKMTLSFHYVEPTYLPLGRQFNLLRHQSEDVSKILTRIGANISGIVERKCKRKMKKMVDQSADLPSQPLISILCNGEPLSGEIKGLAAFQEGNVLKIGELEYSIEVNPPMVKTLDLPNCILAGFPVYPKLEVDFASTTDCVFEWFRSGVLPDEIEGANVSNFIKNWELVGSGFTYVVQTEDIGRKLKLACTPQKDGGAKIGYPRDVISTERVGAGPGFCPFETRHKFTEPRNEKNVFRLVSYNLLADCYADSDYSRTVLFPYCPAYALAIDYRKLLIVKELLGYNADLMCLQEVDQKVNDFDLKPNLLNRGYENVFHLKGGQVGEGLSVYFKTNKFRLISSNSLVLGEVVNKDPLYADLWEKIALNPKTVERLLPRTTTLQAVILESLDAPGEILVVGNTHLYFHPDADHIRLLQSAVILRHLERVVNSEKDKGQNVSLLLCGDFNCTPEYGVYQYVTTKHILEENSNWKSNEEEAVSGLQLTHPFNMVSACGTPPYTNYTLEFNGCLDYIFIDTDRLKVDQVIPLPSHEEVSLHQAIPNVVFPSDHLALVCDVKFVSKN